MNGAAGRLTIATGRTLPALLREGVQRSPRQPLLVFDDERCAATFSWAELDDRARRTASQLHERGVGHGDRVHIHLANRPEFIFVWFAAAYLGASIVPTNVLASPSEVAYILDHADVRLSITDARGVEVVTEAWAQAERGGELIDCDGVVLGSDESEPLDPTTCTVKPDDELAIMYTSGTTARPKGVRITQANYVYAGEVVAAALRLGQQDRFLTVLPLFHANAQNYSTMGTLVGGGTLLLMSRFSATRIMSQAVRYEATVASLFAAPMRMMLAQTPTDEWPQHRLRTVIFAQNLSPDEFTQWDEAIGAPVQQIYGMTETVGPCVMNPLLGVGRPDAIGRPSLGYTCRVVREDGSAAAVGEPGELLVGGVPGVSLMAGYLDNPQATAEALSDGWLRTGDLVVQDPDGLLRFVDRQKDMIKRAGENVAASEVEAVLLEHATVADVAVVGIPDQMRDEQIVAFVVSALGTTADPAELIGWCQERLASFRVPAVVEIVDALPRTSVGKVQKQSLRETYLAAGS